MLAEPSWTRQADRFVKRFPRAALADPWPSIVARLTALSAPPGPGVLVHEATVEGSELVVSTPWLAGTTRLTPGRLAPFLSQLAAILDRNLPELGPHGDLAWDNLLVDRQGELWLVDWEPSHRRFKRGRMSWMTRAHHPLDRAAGRVGRRTDLLGFATLASRELHAELPSPATHAVDRGETSFGELLDLLTSTGR